jgi:N utilization substance protein B
VHRAGLSETAGRFAWELVDGVIAHRPQLDAEIARLAPEWPVSQLAPIDRNILRIALFELRHQPDTPAAAVIDEAVELAKDFGGDASPKFVNGVLASAVRDQSPS